MTMEAGGPTLTTNNVSTSMLTGQAKKLLLPNYFDRIGKAIRIDFAGTVTTTATSSLLHSMSVVFGGSTIFTTAFFNVGIVSTNGSFTGFITLTCRAIGPSANLIGIGNLAGASPTAISSTVFGSLASVPPAVGANFDSTAAQVVDFQMLILTASISSIQLQQYFIESLN